MNIPACNIYYQCPECGHDITIKVSAFYQGKLYGAPENCYPDEWDGFEPTCCPCCDHAFDEDRIAELQRDAHEAQLCARADFKRKERMENPD